MSESLFYGAIFLGIFMSLYSFYKKDKINLKTFGILPFIYLILFSSLYELIITFYLKVDSKIWFRIYNLLEFGCVYYYFYTIVIGFRKLFYFFIFIYLLLYTFLTANWFYISHLKSDSYLITLETLFVFIFTLLWFKQFFKTNSLFSLLSLSDFYFVSGLIIYLAGTFVLNILGDYILQIFKSKFLIYWNIMIAFNIVLRLFIIAGLWKKSTK
jgi:hypothetical protein